MTDHDLEIGSDPEVNDRDVAVAVIIAGLLIAFWAGLAVWLGPTVLTWIALIGAGAALGSAMWLVVERG